MAFVEEKLVFDFIGEIRGGTQVKVTNTLFDTLLVKVDPHLYYYITTFYLLI